MSSVRSFCGDPEDDFILTISSGLPANPRIAGDDTDCGELRRELPADDDDDAIEAAFLASVAGSSTQRWGNHIKIFAHKIIEYTYWIVGRIVR
jgi:hypothetical protein